jgi:hypothetical protein
MGLFKADLYRSFAIGFAAGILALFATIGGEDNGIAANVMPHAVAATAHD